MNVAKLDEICDSIKKQLGSVLGSTAFLGWDKRSQLKIGDLIVVNNSFLRREGDTLKSPKYLCLPVDPDGEPWVLVSKRRINVEFLRITVARRGDYELVELKRAVEDELDQMGTIVFSLIGEIQADEPAETRFPAAIKEFERLCFAPGQEAVAVLNGQDIAINRLDDIDVVWQAISHEVDGAGLSAEIPRLADTFDRVFGDLREAAGRPVNIASIARDKASILTEVVAGVGLQIEHYKEALAAHLADAENTEALNEVMRIAYNFADGSGDLIALMGGLSDLKPLLLWLTISSQINVSECFASLPFAVTGKNKPSIDKYKTIVGGARNQAFHDLFAFGRPFRVPLEGNAFRAAQLRLFREYRRTGSALEFQDRELVQLLEGFTRAAERPVPLGFWEKNSDVMTGVGGMAEALLEALLLAASAGSLHAKE